jgi:hypothetical protein
LDLYDVSIYEMSVWSFRSCKRQSYGCEYAEEARQANNVVVPNNMILTKDPALLERTKSPVWVEVEAVEMTILAEFLSFYTVFQDSECVLEECSARRYPTATRMSRMKWRTSSLLPGRRRKRLVMDHRFAC